MGVTYAKKSGFFQFFNLIFIDFFNFAGNPALGTAASLFIEPETGKSSRNLSD